MSEEGEARPEGEGRRDGGREDGGRNDAAPPEPAEPLARSLSHAGAGQGRPFPVMRVIVGCLGLGLAAWVWLRVSYRWELAPADFAVEDESDRNAGPRWIGRYARLSGICGGEITLGPDRPERLIIVTAPRPSRRETGGADLTPGRPPGDVGAADPTAWNPETWDRAPVLVGKEADPVFGRKVSFSGRVILVRVFSERPRPVLDATMGRWTPPGALALALAAWSVGTAAVALVIWRLSWRS